LSRIRARFRRWLTTIQLFINHMTSRLSEWVFDMLRRLGRTCFNHLPKQRHRKLTRSKLNNHVFEASEEAMVGASVDQGLGMRRCYAVLYSFAIQCRMGPYVHRVEPKYISVIANPRLVGVSLEAG